ncbi:MAG TPA: Uma2 family endonuclease [Bryobacteraceae bacterium]|nr:Uma2 family endonuclease [Bryobacteraceae bacterium]
MSVARSTFLTPEEYLEHERKAEYKSEYLRGEVFAMAGASPLHALIITNLVREFSQALRSRNCNVYSSDLRVRVRPTGLFTYPDVVVVCGAAEFADDQDDTLTNPTLIVEVLSESTQNYDRGQKFQHYRTLPSLREYLTVGQDAVHIEQWTRQPDGRWLLTESSDPAAELVFDSIGVRIGIATLYEKVELPAVE